MNNTFNINRFNRLIKQQYQISGKNSALALLSILIGYTLILLTFTFNKYNIEAIEWLPFFIMLNGAIALPFAAYAFPAFRSKEKTFDYLLIPCSTTEKFIFNIMVRIVLPWIILPVIFYISSHIATELSLWFNPDYYIESFRLSAIFEEVNTEQFSIILTAMILMALIAQSLLFAGATVFKKQPLIKTLVIIGATIAFVIFYFYIIIEWVEVYDSGRMPWVATFENKDSTGYYLVALEIIGLTTTWAYAFFRVKEKEIA
ncbi:hypothetical protein [Carboxylicivirga sp. RSCT41]|uniref:hypothetical protein n=1 Tax=Carboxylicivirga agarovorans TaxID=3417570 RepID=UPI003D33819F